MTDRAAHPNAVEGWSRSPTSSATPEYTALRGDVEALALLSTQDRIVSNTLPQDARVVKELGDGLLLYFAAAASAIATGLLLQHRFEEAADDGALPLWVRIGMHWGRPVSRGEDLVGQDVNVAARIVDVAAPGELLCSNATVAAAGTNVDGIDFVELGPVVMKGFRTVELYRAERVLRPSPVG